MRKAVQYLRGAAILLCALSAALALTNFAATPGQTATPLALHVLLPIPLGGFANRLIGVLVPLAIAAMFWRATRARELETPSRIAVGLLAVQTVFAFLVAEELQFVVAVEAGLLLSPRVGALWVFVQAAAAWLIAALRPELMAWIIPQTADSSKLLMDIAIFMLVAMLYNFLAFSLGLLAASEGKQRRALEAANRELREAQRGVAEAARLAERLRLARELHDAIGHQLAALSINLQIASRVSRDQARRPILEAYQLTGLLLSDLRAVVGATRADEVTDLASALGAIASRVNRPAIHLTLSAEPIARVGLDHALFRCAQELITNAVRHSGAANIFIETMLSGGEYVMTAWDDGNGNTGLAMGNGLKGIEERIREFNGSFQLRNRSGAGFEVTVRVPIAGRRVA